MVGKENKRVYFFPQIFYTENFSRQNFVVIHTHTQLTQTNLRMGANSCIWACGEGPGVDSASETGESLASWWSTQSGGSAGLSGGDRAMASGVGDAGAT